MAARKKLLFDDDEEEEDTTCTGISFVPGAIAFAHTKAQAQDVAQHKLSESLDEANSRLLCDCIKYRLDIYTLLSELRLKDAKIAQQQRVITTLKTDQGGFKRKRSGASSV